MTRLARLFPVVLLLPFFALTASPAQADPVPGIGAGWPTCGTAGDDDGQYCVVSVTRNGLPADTRNCSVPGDYLEPYVDLIGAGDVRFGIYHWVVDDGGCNTLLGDVPPDDVWEFVVNTGAIVPREVYGHIDGVSFSTGGNPTDGYTFTLGLSPTPVAWYGFTPGHDYCSIGNCGDETTVADLHYDGFVTGYVTDLAEWPADQRAARTGMVRTYNAQDAAEYYDYGTNSIVVQMANPHFDTDGTTVAQGTYDVYLPNAYLTSIMNIPDPTSLTGGSFTIRRSLSGTTTSVPVVLTHEAGGIRIRIDGITFSSPTYRIKPRASAPGVPRWGSLSRVTRHEVRLRFRPPVADGGADVTRYQARCRHAAGEWVRASGPGSPLRVDGVPRRSVTCQVRAVNRIGAGDWSTGREG